MKSIDEVLQEHPRLTMDGYMIMESGKEYHGQRRALKAAKDELLIALEFMDKCRKTKHLYPSQTVTATTLKHRMSGRYDKDGQYKMYIPRGIAILAALMKGFDIRTYGEDIGEVRINAKPPKTS